MKTGAAASVFFVDRNIRHIKEKHRKGTDI